MNRLAPSLGICDRLRGRYIIGGKLITIPSTPLQRQAADYIELLERQLRDLQSPPPPLPVAEQRHLRDISDDELRADWKIWNYQVTKSTCCGAALIVSDEFRSEAQSELIRRNLWDSGLNHPKEGPNS